MSQHLMSERSVSEYVTRLGRVEAELLDTRKELTLTRQELAGTQAALRVAIGLIEESEQLLQRFEGTLALAEEERVAG